MNDDIQVLDTGQDTDTSTYVPYEMINFENGTLVTPASANLETGAVTMPVYSGKAPINATNLNHLEQGLKDLETHVLDLPDVENSLVSNSTVNAPSIYSVNEGINNINKNCINLGGTNNETKTITLTNGTLNDYRFLCVSSGWGAQKSTTTIPVSVFKLIGAGFEQCKQYVKTYNASAYTSIQYVNDTSFIINGAVGTDTVTDVYGIK